MPNSHSSVFMFSLFGEADPVRLQCIIAHFSENWWFPDFFQNNSDFFRFQISSDFFRFLQKIYLKISEKRNLNVVTSELDSESLSTLRKIIFKRDSCKLLVDVISVTSACKVVCKRLISENFRKSQKASKSFKTFQKFSEIFRKCRPDLSRFLALFSP
jgi:hypothetical protein